MSKTVCAALLVVIGTPVVAGAGCSATDQAYVHAHKGSDSASFGQAASDCGYKAYSIFDGFNKDIFKTCMEKKTQLSDSCAGCYAGAGQYGADNCKWDCVDSWCSSDCLTCTAKYLGSLQQCTGFKADAVSPCSMSLNTTVVVAGAGCSATDQAYVHAHKGSDSASFGQSASDCGYKAYSIFDGFNKDIFKTCMEKKTQLSDSCAGCYAGAGQYGADNCKWDCMDSWCSSDCLTCTGKYLGSLQQCTGFKADAASPCTMSLNTTVVV